MSTLERVVGVLSGLKFSRVEARDSTPVFEISASDAHEVCRRLRDIGGFETNTFITAIDRYPSEPRFQVCWQFLSIQHNDRVRLFARIADGTSSSGSAARVKPGVNGGDDAHIARHLGDSVVLDTRQSGAAVKSSETRAAAIPTPGGTVELEQMPAVTSVPSIIDLYPGAAYAERECYDMFGIVFDGHADLKRLLMPDGYDHFPLRKDFPHQGIEPDRLYREWDAARHRARVEPPPVRESVP